jgi:hypothetical protein
MKLYMVEEAAFVERMLKRVKPGVRATPGKAGQRRATPGNVEKMCFSTFHDSLTSLSSTFTSNTLMIFL